MGVQVDNVGSNQLQKTRQAIRGTGEILMGKNTMMRKCIAEFVEENPGTLMGQLSDCCRENVGFVFTNGDLGEIRNILESNVRPAPAKVGSLAPIDVVVPAGPTGCDPGQTAFFQTLQISTKITKGQIEMTNDTHLITAGEKVTASQAALLQKLSIEPFSYGLVLKSVYDNGSIFDAKVLDITDNVLAGMFSQALNVVASLSLVLGTPTQASVPHSIANAFEKADVYKQYLADPSKFASASGGGGGGGAAAAVEKVEEKPEEEEMDMAGGIDMFGGEEGEAG